MAESSSAFPPATASDPPQCSLWFEPKEWSRRYPPTCMTAQLLPRADGDSSSTYRIECKCADQNVWILEKCESDFEQLRQELVASPSSSPSSASYLGGASIPALPAKPWTLLPSSTASAAREHQASLSSWLNSVLGCSRTICLHPAIRRFLDLDRTLIPVRDDAAEEENENDDEGKQQAVNGEDKKTNTPAVAQA